MAENERDRGGSGVREDTHRQWKETLIVVKMRVCDQAEADVDQGRGLSREPSGQARGTYDKGADASNEPAYAMCIPVDAVRVPEGRLVDGLGVVGRTEGVV